MQQRSQETRQRILTAAGQLFSHTGYDATGVAQICATAGISKGAFYHHFPTKQAVFLALLNDWLADVDRQMQAIMSTSGSVPDGLINTAASTAPIFDASNGQLPMFLEFWSQARHDPAVWQATIEPYRRYQQIFAALFRRGVEEGSFLPLNPDMAALTLVSLAVGLFLQGVLDPDGGQWSNAMRQGVTWLLNGMVNPIKFSSERREL